jgi:translation initiation factor IF-3
MNLFLMLLYVDDYDKLMVLSGTLNTTKVFSSINCVYWKEWHISAIQYRINEAIRVKEVRLIGANGENVGVVSIQEAMRLANEADLDLVEVAPNSEPPVCRIMDFGKFLYEKTKKEREARRAQTKIEVKEIRLRPKTNVYHQGFKIKDARGWLEQGNKVRVRIRFRGREIDYVDLALNDLKKVAEELADVSSIEQAPMMEGRSVVMVLAPSRTKKSKSS